MDLRFSRMIGLAVVPFLSSASIVGTGFALWIFGEPASVTDSAYVASKGLDVAAASPYPGDLIINRPAYYDSYRIVLDQGGSDAQYDESRGVNLNTPLDCILYGYGLDDWGVLKVQYTLTCSSPDGCLFDETIRFAQYRDASSTDISRVYTLSEEVVTTPTVSDSGQALSFKLDPSFAWHLGKKPTASVSNSAEGIVGWGDLIHQLNALNTTHTLTVVITNQE